MYVVQSPTVNAMTIGMDKPFIVLTTGLVDLMDTDELRFVIGHELGHALSGHAVYRTILMHLMRLAGKPVGIFQTYEPAADPMCRRTRHTPRRG